MQIKPNFKKRKLGRDYIVTAEGPSRVNFNKMIVLNESASYLWDEVFGSDFSAEDLENLLLQRYDVAPSIAHDDAMKVAEQWREAGLLI